jgi:valyl-tRNA synthetase
VEKAYNPKDVEQKLYEFWLQNGYFKPDSKGDQPPFVVVIPPPNVTGELHLGHALDNTIPDVLVRWHRMQGREVLWVPGTDHAGIATQNKVEQRLVRDGKTRFDLGRDNFIKEVWKWKDEYQNTILNQLKRLGFSLDWGHTRFTMDKDYSRAVIKTFVHYYNKGYLYRGNRIINWCPRCGTSLSDLEVEHEEENSFLWYIKYPLKDGGDITVATTRPETMLGDTAIAVNPKDKKYKDYIGKKAFVPIINREIPIIADDLVEVGFGTGAVKVTPAHDPVDFDISEKHKLEKIIVIGTDARMTSDATEQFAGLDRFEAREVIVDLLEKGNWLTKTEHYSHNIGHCYRCHTVIEPLLSLQWFVRMDKLSKPAIDVVKQNRVTFHPIRWKKIYLDWMQNIRDWCVSRQIWWGHQIPAWYCECGEVIVSEQWAEEDAGLSTDKSDKVSRGTKRTCPKCKSSKLTRDNDVLDTWFSSALWPFAVMGWPKETKELEKYYPTSLLSTARDIIYLWVARMIMSGLEFMDEVPFSDVFIHPTVFNKEGKRMSKSLGTGVDPIELVDKYGADATRFGLLWQMAQGQDMRFGEDAILNGQRFANKMWNASRFALMNLEDYEKPTPKDFRTDIEPNLTKEDKIILEKLREAINKTNHYFEKYDFQHAVEQLYEFFWHDFCDKTIEDTKIRIRESDKTKKAAQYTLHTVLCNSLKLLHPIMPFVTEEIWSNLKEDKPLIISNWPKA